MTKPTALRHTTPQVVARVGLALLFCAILGTIGRPAYALPTVGAERPDVRLTDPWDRTNQLRRFANKPVLLVYEDKDSAALNMPLKQELSRFAKEERYRKAVALVPVADVAGYDYWPIRGFVKDAIQEESHKQGAIIYCDWDGSIRNTLGLQRGTSNVVLYAKSGKVIFAQAGALSEAARKTLIDALRHEVEG